jgi:outer membrane protein insertion porin family
MAFTPRGALAQASLFLVNAETEVRAVGFRFVDHETFPPSQLTDLLTYTDPGGWAGVRRFISFLPLLSPPTPILFVPLELQRDLARLRSFYSSAGFPRAELSYDVRFDQGRNIVRITFVIREGEPLRRGSLEVSAPDGSNLDARLPEELRREWQVFQAGLRPREGERVGELERLVFRDGVATWLRNRGWVFPQVSTDVSIDAGGAVADVRLVVDPGQRVRIDSIAVQGNQRLSAPLVRRSIPLRPGDWFSASGLASGREHLFALDLVRFAGTDPSSNLPSDSTVVVVVRIEEGRPRLITAEGGYATESGVTAALSWAHRDFLGGARTLTVSTTGQTGILGLANGGVARYGGAVSLKQPFLFDSRSTGIVRPYVNYRDDLLDRSLEVGTELTAVYQPTRSQSLSLRYGISQRHVFTYRGGGSADIDLLTRLAVLDSLDTRVRTSALTATWLGERLNDARDPSSGYVVRASLEVAGPGSISTVEYGRLEVSAVSLWEVSRGTSLVAKVGFGRLFPFGKSEPGAGESVLREFLPLRNAVFTAGGSYDVRGWGEGMLGPKVPDYVGDLSAPETLTASRYVPFGGLARSQATLELRLPIPFFRRPRGLVGFLDSGRVWYPDPRFNLGTSDSHRFFYSVGGGLRLGTPVGPVGVLVGYKLNPSVLDVRDPNEVTRALVEGRSILTVPTKDIMRFHLHITLGRDF